MVISFLAMRSTSYLLLILFFFSWAKKGAAPWSGFLSIIPFFIFSLIHKLMSFTNRSGIQLVGRVLSSPPGIRRISSFVFLSGGSTFGMTSGNTSEYWSITSSVVIMAALTCLLVSMEWILIPNLRKSISNPPHSILASGCFRNGLSFRGSYLARFLTSILFPVLCSVPTARSNPNSLWFSDCDWNLLLSIVRFPEGYPLIL